MNKKVYTYSKTTILIASTMFFFKTYFAKKNMFPQIWYHASKTNTCLAKSIQLKSLMNMTHKWNHKVQMDLYTKIMS